VVGVEVGVDLATDVTEVLVTTGVGEAGGRVGVG
jgi:hypothetical protein